jgi:tryptophan-rich sensory protein
MSGFNFQKYFIRVLKYMVYLAIIFVLIVSIFSLTSSNGFNYENLFRPGTGIQMITFFVVISLIYPLFGFIKKRVYLNKPFSEEREKIVEIFTNSRYKIIAENESTIVFRHTSPFIRAMRMFEDDVTVNFSDNPIILEGQRKDVYRIARTIEWFTRDSKKEE